MDEGSPNPDLDERETTLLNCLVAGLSNKDIARQLDMEVTAVSSALHRLYAKLGVGTRPGAVRWQMTRQHAQNSPAAKALNLMASLEESVALGKQAAEKPVAGGATRAVTENLIEVVGWFGDYLGPSVQNFRLMPTNWSVTTRTLSCLQADQAWLYLLRGDFHQLWHFLSVLRTKPETNADGSTRLLEEEILILQAACAALNGASELWKTTRDCWKALDADRRKYAGQRAYELLALGLTEGWEAAAKPFFRSRTDEYPDLKPSAQLELIFAIHAARLSGNQSLARRGADLLIQCAAEGYRCVQATAHSGAMEWVGLVSREYHAVAARDGRA